MEGERERERERGDSLEEKLKRHEKNERTSIRLIVPALI